jgi:hypothetical protein
MQLSGNATVSSIASTCLFESGDPTDFARVFRLGKNPVIALGRLR